ncbi:hypothetical protein ILUMI_07508 [Ignelater luminosus]|uniref:Retinol dehydrogenase 13 n=1 Tax=Ignelater luminosus TaxID=2038154 RepID=A0A8K0D3T0_IGNLU|nr:hypothetical protein ILUMI_07508 [Ignelater luminosus]
MRLSTGARVIMACRSVEKAEEAAKDIQKACEGEENLGKIVIVHLDLSSLESVREFTKEILQKEDRVDLLVNNAGVMMCPESRTVDGYETQFATNHLGHFLLTLLLMPKIIKSTPARIVNVSSLGHTRK